MKKLVNTTKRLRVLDLNSFDDSGRRKSVHIAPESSVVIEDTEANSKQVVKALNKGIIKIDDLEKEVSKKPAVEKKEEVLKKPEQEETKMVKKFKKKNNKTSNKEDK